MKMKWTKPVVVAIKQEDLVKHIKVAARSSSGGCSGVDGR